MLIWASAVRQVTLKMICWTFLVVSVWCLLDDRLHVHAASVIDVKERFHYSLHRDINQAFTHPSIESLLGLPSDVTLQEEATYVTAHGTHRRRLRELYKGIQVINANVEADVTGTGKYDTGPVTGTLVVSLQRDIPDPTCTLTESEARDIVFIEESFPEAAVIKKEDYLKTVYVDTNKRGHLTYVADILVKLSQGEKRPYYIIDCRTGEVLIKSSKLSTQTSQDTTQTLAWDTGSTESWFSPSPKTASVSPVTTTTTQTPPTTTPTTTTPGSSSTQCTTYVKGTGGNLKLGKVLYSEAPYKYCLDVTKAGSTCKLDNQYVKVVNLENTENTDKDDAFEFDCAQGFNDYTNGAYSPLLDAHYFGTLAFRVFNDWYGISPLTSKPRMLVHYGVDEENAFWDGQVMAFGDGKDEFYPFVSLDVVNHELAHGVTDQNSNLIYSEQSGGINEAFSDMAGEVAEAYARGSNDWKIGYYIFKDPDGAMRYFDNPTKDGNSINHADNFESGMDVHFSSGVFNKAFYTIVETGKVPIRYAFESFLKANQVYWKEGTNFVEGACGAIRGAYDAGLDTEQFNNAFKGVGLNPCPLSDYLQPLNPSTPRSGVTVSSIRQPLFGIRTLSNTKKVTVTAVSTSGANVKLDLLKTISRANAFKTGTGSVDMDVEANVQYFVRAYTSSTDEIKDVTLTATFET